MKRFNLKFKKFAEEKSKSQLFVEITLSFIAFISLSVAIASWMNSPSTIPPLKSMLFFSTTINVFLLFKYLSCRSFANDTILKRIKQ